MHSSTCIIHYALTLYIMERSSSIHNAHDILCKYCINHTACTSKVHHFCQQFLDKGIVHWLYTSWVPKILMQFQLDWVLWFGCYSNNEHSNKCSVFLIPRSEIQCLQEATLSAPAGFVGWGLTLAQVCCNWTAQSIWVWLYAFLVMGEFWISKAKQCLIAHRCFQAWRVSCLVGY